MSELMSNLNSALIQTLLHFMEKGLICCAICPGASTLRVDLQSSHSHDLLGLCVDGDRIWRKHPAVFTFSSYLPPSARGPPRAGCEASQSCINKASVPPFANNQVSGVGFLSGRAPAMVQFHCEFFVWHWRLLYLSLSTLFSTSVPYLWHCLLIAVIVGVFEVGE